MKPRLIDVMFLATAATALLTSTARAETVMIKGTTAPPEKRVPLSEPYTNPLEEPRIQPKPFLPIITYGVGYKHTEDVVGKDKRKADGGKLFIKYMGAKFGPAWPRDARSLSEGSGEVSAVEANASLVGSSQDISAAAKSDPHSDHAALTLRAKGSVVYGASLANEGCGVNVFGKGTGEFASTKTNSSLESPVMPDRSIVGLSGGVGIHCNNPEVKVLLTPGFGYRFGGFGEGLKTPMKSFEFNALVAGGGIIYWTTHAGIGSSGSQHEGYVESEFDVKVSKDVPFTIGAAGALRDLSDGQTGMHKQVYEIGGHIGGTWAQ